MEQLTVDLGARSYPILIGDGLIRSIGEHVAPLLKRPRTMIVTDAHVADHYLVPLGTALAMANISFSSFVLDPGEATKSWAGLARLTDWLIGEGIERSDHVIALGGGVIGDLVGFACSIVKRGCHFVQVPTTLLAQVDSSVGGKTAINVAAGKNMIGAFHQPALVVIDPATLATLPRRDLAAGYAEVVKYGLIDDADFFAWCEAEGAALLAGEKTEFKEWEHNTPYFQGCQPIEVIASTGPQSLRFGPMKPVGLRDPRTGHRPWAVVQLRQDNALGTLWNIVGFQTKLKHGEQTRIFRTIPGLQNAEFARLGGLHRNTFLNSPRLLDGTLRLRPCRGCASPARSPAAKAMSRARPSD
eukprot:gene33742-41625_t